MTEDRELVERCRAGDVEAFHGLVERYREPIYRLVWRFVGNHHDALEISQEAFAKGFEKLDGYDVRRPFSSWILTIAANLARDLLRKRVRRSTILDDECLRQVAGGESPDVTASEREQVERLRRAVDELDHDKRLAVLLRYFEGMSLKEMAEVTGVEPNTLKVRLFRARQDLLKTLDGPQ